jgi:predicted anti-sigma-YlaC factor YlaD
MNCEEARTILLDSLAGSILAQSDLMEGHLATCKTCRQFAEVQRSLDARLTAAAPFVSLSPKFRSSLQTRINERHPWKWPEYLPDVAHLTGCVLAIALLLLLMPQFFRTILLAGTGFTAVTYFLQAVLRSSLERLEHTR